MLDVYSPRDQRKRAYGAMRVLLTATNALARSAAADALRGHPSVLDVRDMEIGAADEPSEIDLVVVEQSVGAISLRDLDEVTSRYPDAAVVSISLQVGDAYTWVRLRRDAGWYFVEETGTGTIAALTERAATAWSGSRLFV